jgi:Kef-type K+ transport system membrane component KefB
VTDVTRAAAGVAQPLTERVQRTAGHWANGGQTRGNRRNVTPTEQPLDTLLAVLLVAALAPVIAVLPGPRIPQVVVLIFGGVLIGPQGLAIGRPGSISLLSDIGLGFLFLLAGYELEPGQLRERSGRMAITGWLVSAALAVAAVRRSEYAAVGSLVVVLVAALLLTAAPRAVAERRLRALIKQGQRATAQTTLRWSVVLLIVLLSLAEHFGLDVVLGAVLAGLVLRRWTRRMEVDVEPLESKLEAVGYGVFIPPFFVASGMSLDVRSIIHNPLRLVVFAVLLLVVPNAAALVGAGVVSVLVYPAMATLLRRTAVRSERR